MFFARCISDQKVMVFEQKLEEHARKEKLRGNHVPSVLLKLYRCNLESGTCGEIIVPLRFRSNISMVKS